jgi:hypothetical protein
LPRSGGHRFSFTTKPMTTLINDNPLPTSIISYENNKLKPRKIKIQLTNNKNSELSKSFKSLCSAATYFKEIDSSSDRGTMRKYINSGKP